MSRVNRHEAIANLHSALTALGDSNDDHHLCAAAILMQAAELHHLYSLMDLVDMSQDVGKLTQIWAEFERTMVPGREYGTQVLVPDSIFRHKELLYLSEQRDESLRSTELNAIVVKDDGKNV